MSTCDYELATPPEAPRARELWLQHAIGFALFEDVRGYATEHIDPELPPDARAAVQKGIDDAIYGLMMVIDGVTGDLTNSTHGVELGFIARLVRRDDSGERAVVSELDLLNGDGMCMGYHG